MADTGKEKSRIEVLEETVAALAEKVDSLSAQLTKVEKTAVKKTAGLFGGKRERVAIKDTKTDKVYISKAATGKALASEVDSTPEDHFAWYKLIAKFPDRFVEASPAEKAQVEKEEADRLAKLVEEANKKLAAEEAAAAKAAAPKKSK